MLFKPVGYILGIGSGDRGPVNLVNIDLYSVEQYSDSKSVEYNFVSVIGRNSPLVVWSSGGSRKLSLSIKFFAYEDAKREVYDKIEALRRLCEPQGVAGRYVIPPPITIAKVFSYKIRGVVENLQVGGGEIYPVSKELYPILETVQLEIVEVRQ